MAAVGDRSVIWQAVRAEPRRLVTDLEDIAPEQWQAPSLCPGWSVHDVLALSSTRQPRPGSGSYGTC